MLITCKNSKVINILLTFNFYLLSVISLLNHLRSKQRKIIFNRVFFIKLP